MSIGYWWNMRQGKTKGLKKNVSTINPMWINMGLNPRAYSGQLAIKCLCCGMAYHCLNKTDIMLELLSASQNHFLFVHCNIDMGKSVRQTDESTHSHI